MVVMIKSSEMKLSLTTARFERQTFDIKFHTVKIKRVLEMLFHLLIYHLIHLIDWWFKLQSQ